MKSASDIEALLAETSALDAAGLVAWAVGHYGAKVAFASSLGAEDQVLTDMVSRVAQGLSIFSIDTGRLPVETYDLLDSTRRHYGLRIEVLFPAADDVAPVVSEWGPNLFRESVEQRKLCCLVRKVRPLKRKLAGLSAWITGLRRDQALTRTELQRIEWDEGNGLVKINPLADWSEEAVWDYIRQHNVPYNALHDQGYPSIGCGPCTRAIFPGEDVRAGRWWWELPEHKEIGRAHV